jgi:hypothetical protein
VAARASRARYPDLRRTHGPADFFVAVATYRDWTNAHQRHAQLHEARCAAAAAAAKTSEAEARRALKKATDNKDVAARVPDERSAQPAAIPEAARPRVWEVNHKHTIVARPTPKPQNPKPIRPHRNMRVRVAEV